MAALMRRATDMLVNPHNLISNGLETPFPSDSPICIMRSCLSFPREFSLSKTSVVRQWRYRPQPLDRQHTCGPRPVLPSPSALESQTRRRGRTREHLYHHTRCDYGQYNEHYDPYTRKMQNCATTMSHTIQMHRARCDMPSLISLEHGNDCERLCSQA